MARLIDELKKLPGVGSKSAQRLAFHILRSSEDDADALAGAIHDVKASLRLCSVCNNITDVDPCTYCASTTRNKRLFCVVEEPTNIAAVEKTRTVDIVDFVKAEEIDDRFFETPYYLVPVKGGERAYALLREAIRDSKRVGIAKFILRDVQHLAAVGKDQPRSHLLVSADDDAQQRDPRARGTPEPD